MKQVTAIIKPFRLNEVRDALNAIGVSGLTVIKFRAMDAKEVKERFIAALNMK